MTQVDFYFNAPDKFGTACRLVQKGYSLGNRIVALCADPEAAQRFDRMLWTTPATGFTPHCAARDALAAVTPVIIDHEGREPVHDQVLVNLRDECPALFTRFERLIEIVTADEADKERARTRFKFYKDRGYAMRTHDLAQL